MRKVGEVVKTTGKVSGFLLGEEDYEHGYGNNVVEVLGDYVTLYRPDMYFVNLSIPDSLLKVGLFDSNVKKILADNDFYRFMMMQNKNNTFSSVEKSRHEFLDKVNIKFLFASPHAVFDSTLETRVQTRIEDPYSGHVFVGLTKRDK
jgi:hypothetical protein